MRAFVGLMMVLGLGLTEKVALANSGCDTEKTLPNGPLPQNLTAMPYQENGEAFGGASSSPATGFRFEGPDGAEVPSTLGDDPWWPGGKLFTFEGELALGSGYGLEYTGGCNRESDDTIRLPYRIVAAPPAPTTTGTLTGEDRKRGPAKLALGCCYPAIEAVTMNLVLQPSTELAAFSAVTGYQVFVDDAPVKATFYGAATADDRGAVDLGLFFSRCGTEETSDTGAGTEVSSGSHTIRVEPHVLASVAAPPAVSATLDFSCGGAGAASGGASGPSEDDGGCTSAPASQTGGGWLFALAVVIAGRAAVRARASRSSRA